MEQQKKFKLNNVLLYIKGFYKPTFVNRRIDIVNDMKEMLVLDGYSETMELSDIYYIVLGEFEEYMRDRIYIYRFMGLVAEDMKDNGDDFMTASLYAMYYTLRYADWAHPYEMPVYDRKHRRISTDHEGMTYREMTRLAKRNFMEWDKTDK